jgi:pyrroloquinoline quinone (PQQ) biosynthesis protein C
VTGAIQLRHQLTADLSELRNTLWSTDLLRNPPSPIEADALLIAHELRSYTSVFPRCLGMLISQTDDDVARAILVENLWEEHGSGDLRRSHRVLYERFFTSLRTHVMTGSELPSTPLDSTLYASDALMQVAASGFVRGLGALAVGVEADTPAQFGVVQSYFAALPFGTELDIEFFTLHIASDDQHADAMMDVLARYVVDDGSYAEALDGSRSAVNADFRFWEGLNDALTGRDVAAS